MDNVIKSDLIRRDDALRALDESFEVSGPAYRQMEHALASLPAVGLEWIRCKDALPGNNNKTKYLVCASDGYVGVLPYYNGWNCSSVFRDAEIESIVAWLPLPDLIEED